MSHLHQVDCVDCGRYIYAAAEAREPRCAECGRNAAGAHAHQTPWPASWTSSDEQAPRPPTADEGPLYKWTVFCPRCSWTTRTPYEDSVWSVLRWHETRAHRGRRRAPRRDR